MQACGAQLSLQRQPSRRLNTVRPSDRAERSREVFEQVNALRLADDGLNLRQRLRDRIEQIDLCLFSYSLSDHPARVLSCFQQLCEEREKLRLALQRYSHDPKLLFQLPQPPVKVTSPFIIDPRMINSTLWTSQHARDRMRSSCGPSHHRDILRSWLRKNVLKRQGPLRWTDSLPTVDWLSRALVTRNIDASSVEQCVQQGTKVRQPNGYTKHTREDVVVITSGGTQQCVVTTWRQSPSVKISPVHVSNEALMSGASLVDAFPHDSSQLVTRNRDRWTRCHSGTRPPSECHAVRLNGAIRYRAREILKHVRAMRTSSCAAYEKKLKAIIHRAFIKRAQGIRQIRRARWSKFKTFYRRSPRHAKPMRQLRGMSNPRTIALIAARLELQIFRRRRSPSGISQKKVATPLHHAGTQRQNVLVRLVEQSSVRRVDVKKLVGYPAQTTRPEEQTSRVDASSRPDDLQARDQSSSKVRMLHVNHLYSHNYTLRWCNACRLSVCTQRRATAKAVGQRM